MALLSEWVQFNSKENTHKMYVSRLSQATTPLPVVLVIQEIWGTDSHILELTDRFAEAGYLAVAPDLYAENGQRPEAFSEGRIERVKEFLNSVPPTVWHDPDAREQELNKIPEPKRSEIKTTFTELFGGLGRLPERLETLRAVVEYLQHQYPHSQGQKIASTGYCMGGALSVRLASVEPALAGAVVYYGNLLGKEEVQSIQCPVIGFFGSLDERITSQVEPFALTMKESGKTFSYDIYPGAHHAFFNDTRASYNVNAARDAWVKTLAFFRQVLV